MSNLNINWNKGLTAAIALSLVAGIADPVMGTAEAAPKKFTQAITGDASMDRAYTIMNVRTPLGEYVFDKDTTIEVTRGGAIDTKGPVTVKAEGFGLTLNAGTDSADVAMGLGIQGKGKSSVTAKSLDITAVNKGSLGFARAIYTDNSTQSASSLEINADVNMTAKSCFAYAGITASGLSTITVNGNVTAKGTEEDPWAISNIDTEGSQPTYAALSAVFNKTSKKGAHTIINGLVDLDVNGTGIYADDAGSRVDVKGGRINVNTAEGQSRYALATFNGATINLNHDGEKAGEEKVVINGDAGMLRGFSAVRRTSPQKVAEINIGLTTEDSSWKGVIDNKYTEKDTGKGFDGQANIVLKNGATWTNEAYGYVERQVKTRLFTGTRVENLTGAAEGEKPGYLVQNESTPLTLNNYAGNMVLVYAHEGDGTEAGSYKAGDTHIVKAAEGAEITVSTDNSGMDMNDKEAVAKALDTLAGKLFYDGFAAGEQNLSGTARIASGLTADGAALRFSGIRFLEDGEGSIDRNAVEIVPDASQGDEDGKEEDDSAAVKETSIMQGVRSAMTTSAHAWRANMADTYRIADKADEDGIFARAYGGKTKYEGNGIQEKNSYRGAQLGYDKAAGEGFHTGIAFNYEDGDAKYLLGGEGDNKLYSLGIYGVKKEADGSELRLAAKFGRVKNGYKVYNEDGARLDGDLGANAFGITAEYGKKFGAESGYWMPTAQLSWSRVSGKDYTAHSGENALQISQDAYSSLVGRLGLEAGMEAGRGSLYARAGIAHEFSGDIDATYEAKDGGKKATRFDGKDTWAEIALGGSYAVSGNGSLYLDLAKDLGGDFRHDWNVNAGLRFTF